MVIITKDILEDLVREEGWVYTNIYPEGRKIPGLHVLLGRAHQFDQDDLPASEVHREQEI